jgi:Fe2+ or Zn2+ uptake regulation protein
VLELLVELGLVRRIDAGLGAALYDARTEPHQHTVCRGCGRVDDLDGEIDLAALEQASARAGFRAQGVEVVISGVCAECAECAAAAAATAA